MSEIDTLFKRGHWHVLVDSKRAFVESNSIEQLTAALQKKSIDTCVIRCSGKSMSSTYYDYYWLKKQSIDAKADLPTFYHTCVCMSYENPFLWLKPDKFCSVDDDDDNEGDEFCLFGGHTFRIIADIGCWNIVLKHVEGPRFEKNELSVCELNALFLDAINTSNVRLIEQMIQLWARYLSYRPAYRTVHYAGDFARSWIGPLLKAHESSFIQ